MKLSGWVLGGLVLASASVQAVPIAGLVNTGVGASGSVDTNYKFTVATPGSTATGTPCGSEMCGVVTDDANGFPLDPWLLNSASSASKWLTPTILQSQSYDPSTPGKYNWTLTFDLSGFDATTASFSGRFLSDNNSSISLNINNSIGVSSANSFLNWAAFTVGPNSTYFQSGINTVVFEVTNGAQATGNPTGLRVEFLASNVSPVPEPEGYALGLAGMAAMVGLMRRRTVKR
jgi:hypothetical protein